MASEKGFTLIELMIVIALVGIIAAIAAPNFRESSQKNKLLSDATAFNALLKFARSESIRTGRKVSVAPLTGGWNTGMLVFYDGNDNLVFAAADDEELRRAELEGESTITANPTAAFNFDGSGTIGAQQTFKFCDGRTGEQGWLVTVLASGLTVMAREGCS